MITRRVTVISLLAAGCVRPNKTGDQPPTPTEAQLQDGDFLWPRKPDAWIPYIMTEYRGARPQSEEQAFLDGKAGFLARQDALSASDPSRLKAADLQRIRAMTYAQFRAYYDDAGRSAPGGRALGAFSVGHIAIVARGADGKVDMIEAVWGDVAKVRRISYSAWLGNHAGDWIFHGRLRGRSQDERSSMRAEAERHIGAPYDFWDMNLNNDRGFYCSKLAWLSTWRALGVSLDADDDPHRGLWFSPKQMFNCGTVEHINGCCYLA